MNTEQNTETTYQDPVIPETRIKTTARSFAQLKRLQPDQLIEKLESLNEHYQLQLEYVDNQYQLWRWRILWELRQHYPNDRQFGAYIADLRASRAIRAGCAQNINRQLHAGRFCELYGIHDLNEAGLLQSAIYELSRPMNIGIAAPVFHLAKNKNLPLQEVLKLIEKARPVATIEQSDSVLTEQHKAPIEAPPILERNPSITVYPIHVVNNIAQTDYPETPPMPLLSARPTLTLKAPVAPGVDIAEERRNADKTDRRELHLIYNSLSAPVDLRHATDAELLRELAGRDGLNLKDEQIIEELMLFTERYKRSFIKLISLFQACIKQAQSMIYRKTV